MLNIVVMCACSSHFYFSLQPELENLRILFATIIIHSCYLIPLALRLCPLNEALVEEIIVAHL